MVQFIKEQMGAGGDAYAAAVPNGRCDNIRGPLHLRLRRELLELDQQSLHPPVVDSAEFTRSVSDCGGTEKAAASRGLERLVVLRRPRSQN